MCVGLKWSLLLQIFLLLPLRYANSSELSNTAGRSLASETELRQYLDKSDKILTEWKGKVREAEFDITVDPSPERQKVKKKLAAEAAAVYGNLLKEVEKFDVHRVANKTLARLLKRTLMQLDPDTKAMKELSAVVKAMDKITTSAAINLPENRTLRLKPELVQIMAKARNYRVLFWAWKGIHDAIGKRVHPLFVKYVKLANQVARESSIAGLRYDNRVGLWLTPYEIPNLKDKAHKLWLQVKPLYDDLHEFVRRKLLLFYSGHMRDDKTIPAHILGDLFAQDWTYIMDIVNPFKGLASLDISDELKKQHFTVKKMVEQAESFFVSIGFPKMKPSFWKKSVFQSESSVKNRPCFAGAMDFFRQDDFRMFACLPTTLVGFRTAHHELGHVHYYMQYKHLPFAFRDGATPAVHEAVGDIIGLSATSPVYLKQVGLLKGYKPSPNATLHHLLQQAILAIPALAYCYALEYWRWQIFEGKVKPDDYNEFWWTIRNHKQRISPPVPRSKNDLDPASKMHVTKDVEYIRYYLGFFIKFQIHKKLCDVANQKAYHECTIAGNLAAGNKLREFLRQGASVSGDEQIVQLTGETLNAKPLLDYFKPLHEFLKQENSKPFETPDDFYADGFGGDKQTEHDISTNEAAVLIKELQVQPRKLNYYDQILSAPDPLYP